MTRKRTQEPFEKRFLKPPKPFELRGISELFLPKEHLNSEDSLQIPLRFTGTGFTSEKWAMPISRGHGK